MIIFTDDIKFAKRYFPALEYKNVSQMTLTDNLDYLIRKFFSSSSIFTVNSDDDFWNFCFIVKETDNSQYDLLVEMMGGKSQLSANILCLTGTSKALHGFRNRPWKGELGNIHLSVYLKPDINVDNPSVVFLTYAAVSTLNAIKKVKALKAQPQIKWVNDILIGDAKVAGVLAHTSQMNKKITGAVIGIGINVNTKPNVEPTRFVPYVTTINENTQNNKTTESIVFKNLIDSLKYYFQLIQDNKFSEILREYRSNSMLIGKKIRIWSDPFSKETEQVLYEGIVTKIGQNLELYLNNFSEPIITGRPEILI